MTFTFDATPEPSHNPPRILLTATESDAAKPLQSCTFYRDGVALRFSPVITGQVAVAYDYDAPFDVALAYRADAVEADTIALDWTETWASIAAWTVIASGWSVGSGIATGVTTGVARIRRSSAGSIAKVHGVSPTVASTGSEGSLNISLLDASASVLASLTFNKFGQTITLLGTSGVPVSVSGVAPTTFDVIVSATSVTASGSGWSLTAPFVGTATQVQLTALSFVFSTVTATIDDVSVYTFPDPPTIDVTGSETVTLDGGDAAWLVNAAQPELAVMVTPSAAGADDDLVFSPETWMETTSEPGTVQLDIEGSADTVTVVTGPRKRKTGNMVIHCRTAEANDAIDELLANSAPISIRYPASLASMHLADGFYSVGTLGSNRLQTPTDDRPEYSTVTLPLTPSRAPAFDSLWQWNWDALAQSGMTWDQAAAIFADWNALLVGPTS